MVKGAERSFYKRVLLLNLNVVILSLVSESKPKEKRFNFGLSR